MNIGYARVSKMEQNLDLQLRALKKAGCDKIYIDNGVSAVAKKRPRFAAALNQLKRGDVLVIWNLDRAFRSLREALNTLEEFEQRGIEFKSTTQHFDTSTPIGRLVFQICSAFAEFEREMISARTLAGLEAARERGKTLGRPRKLKDLQVRRAHILIVRGRGTVKSIASKLNVSSLTLSRAIQKFEKVKDIEKNQH